MTDEIKEILEDIEHLTRCQDEGTKRSIMTRIILGIEAQRGLDKQVDTGPWVVSKDGRTISSDDFDHDVHLRVNGDFYSDEQRAAYSKGLASRLAGLPKQPPFELLWSMAARLRPDFGLDADDMSPIASGFTPQEREVILEDMRRLYEEVTGQGFFKWTNS